MRVREGLVSLRAQWRESAPLRLGSWLILFILIGYGLTLLSDYRSRLGEQYAEAEARIARLQGITQETEWPKRAQEANERRKVLEKQLWHAENHGLASAAMQSWLNEALRKSEIEEGRIQVKTAREVDGFAQLMQVRAQVKGVFEDGAIIDLIKDVETNHQLTVVESLDVMPGRRNIFDLEIKAFFLLGETK